MSDLPPKRVFSEDWYGSSPAGDCVIYNQCDSTEYCSVDDKGVGTCVDKKEDGESCALEGGKSCISRKCENKKCVCKDCAGIGLWPEVQLYCYGGACREKLNNGEPCGDDNDCKSDNCDNFWWWSSDSCK